MMSNGLPSDKLVVIHNSLDYDVQLRIRERLKPSDIYKSHFKNDNANIIFIGRLTHSKRIDLLLSSVAQLSKKGLKFNVVLVGDGEGRKDLEQMVVKLNLPNVWFYGASYDEEQNAKLIYNSDFCVSPGNVGLTAIHCLTFGTPVLTHNDFPYQGPEFEVIEDGKTGAFFERNSESSLAIAIENLNRIMSECGRDTIRRNCYDKIDKEWNPNYQIRVFKEVLNS